MASGIWKRVASGIGKDRHSIVDSTSGAGGNGVETTLSYDLHLHTRESDGSLSPEELVAAAAAAGLTTIAVTDHDTVAALDAAARAVARHGMRLIAGIELSTTHEGRDLHLLAYGLDPPKTALLEALTRTRAARIVRAQAIVDNLASMGVELDWEAVAAQGQGTLARPHIARAMVAAGYVSSVAEAFDRYLAEGQAAFLPSGKLTTAEAIALVREAGGYAFVAHPILPTKVLDLPTLLPPLCAAGLAGLETYYSGYTPEQSAALRATAQQAGLMYSGGSDFHGTSKPHISLGEVALPTDILTQQAVQQPHTR